MGKQVAYRSQLTRITLGLKDKDALVQFFRTNWDTEQTSYAMRLPTLEFYRAWRDKS